MERKGDEPWSSLYETRPYLTLGQWSIADCGADYDQCGLAGSPTKVKTVQNIVFQAKESKTLTGSDNDVERNGWLKNLSLLDKQRLNERKKQSHGQPF